MTQPTKPELSPTPYSHKRVERFCEACNLHVDLHPDKMSMPASCWEAAKQNERLELFGQTWGREGFDW